MKRICAKASGFFMAAVSILLACVITGILMYGMGYNPLDAYYQLFFGAVVGLSALSESVVKMVPLVFTGLSFAIAKRSGLVNLGATGQLYIGALCTTVVGVYVTGLPAALHIPLALAAGCAGGAAYGAVVGFLKLPVLFCVPVQFLPLAAYRKALCRVLVAQCAGRLKEGLR